MRVLLQALRTPLVASAFFFFWMGAVFLAWFVCPVLAVAHPDPVARRHFCQRIVKRAFRLFHAYMRLLGLVDSRVVGPWASRPAGPFVMVSNHPTLVDVTAILAHYDELCCVVKTSLIQSFFVGRLLRFCGHIDGGDGGAMSGAATLQEAQRRLDEGDGVLIFPEGARSPRRAMHRFRRGSFELATRAGVPLWPVFVACDPPALSRGVPIWRHPERAAQHQLTPQPLVPPGTATATRRSGSSRAMCKTVERACHAWLEHRGLIDGATQAQPLPLNVDEPAPSSYKLAVDAVDPVDASEAREVGGASQ
jgi:1-acyl-sn-glycerol-3-phosphate acyltransferase